MRLSAERTSVDESVGASIFAASLIENQPRRGRRTSSCGEHEKKCQEGQGRQQDAVKKREKWQETNRVKKEEEEEEEEEEERHVTSRCRLFRQP